MPVYLPRIYPITDKKLARSETHYSILRELVRGGASVVQIRDKETVIRELLPDLLRCAEFARKNRICLIVNDRCDLALTSGASGVHLGREDLPPVAARPLLGRQSIIGYSTHSVSEIQRSKHLPVDYFGFGPVYPTGTKSNPDPATGLTALRRACRAATRPVVAIGGIGPEQVAEVLQAGAHSAALISALMGVADLAKEMERLLKIARERG